MEDIFRQAALAILPPLLFVGVLFARIPRRSWGLSVGICIAMMWVYLVLHRIWWPDPSRGVTHCFPWGALVGLVAVLLGRRQRTYSAFVAVMGICMTCVLIQKSGIWPGEDWQLGIVLGLCVLGVGAFSHWRVRTLSEVHLRDELLVRALTVAALVPMALFAGTSRLAQMIGAVGAFCVIGFLLSALRRAPERLSCSAQWLLSFPIWWFSLYFAFFLEEFPVWVLVPLAVGGWGALVILGLSSRLAVASERLTARIIAFFLLLSCLGTSYWGVWCQAPRGDRWGL